MMTTSRKAARNSVVSSATTNAARPCALTSKAPAPGVSGVSRRAVIDFFRPGAGWSLNGSLSSLASGALASPPSSLAI